FRRALLRESSRSTTSPNRSDISASFQRATASRGAEGASGFRLGKGAVRAVFLEADYRSDFHSRTANSALCFSFMKDMSWEAYRIFLDVARQGGLTGAAQVSGLSPATVGRRVLQLEEAIGRPLFLRSQAGYRLTGDGQALFGQLLAMEAVVRGVESWRQEGQGASVV